MKAIRMSAWEDVVGPVLNVQMDEGYVLAQIGKISVKLPPELEQKLLSLIGVQVAILHTDIPGKEYLVRAIHKEKPDHEIGSDASEERIKKCPGSSWSNFRASRTKEDLHGE